MMAEHQFQVTQLVLLLVALHVPLLQMQQDVPSLVFLMVLFIHLP
jgi:hypothetical protein